jgi:hypothetical protein
MICPQCQTSNPDDAGICGHCRRELAPLQMRFAAPGGAPPRASGKGRAATQAGSNEPAMNYSADKPNDLYRGGAAPPTEPAGVQQRADPTRPPVFARIMMLVAYCTAPLFVMSCFRWMTDYCGVDTGCKYTSIAIVVHGAYLLFCVWIWFAWFQPSRARR